MFRKLLSIRFVIEVLILLLFTGDVSKAQVTRHGQESLLNKARVRCIVSVKDAALKADAENMVVVGIRNNTSASLSIASLTIYLSRSPYPPAVGGEASESDNFAPVSLETKEALVPKQVGESGWRYPETSMTVAAGREEIFSVNLSSLTWGNYMAEQMPFQRVHSLEPGKYYLFAVVMEQRKNTEVNSKRIAVTLTR